MIEPQVLPQLSNDELLGLINCFAENKMMQEYPGRAFALDLDPAMEIVKPIIDKVLGHGTWERDGGNFFLTNTGYRVHADTGKQGAEKVWQTFVFPLAMTIKPNVVPQLEKNKLLILNQTWSGDAAFFMRGSPENPNEYNIVVKDYDTVGNIEHGTMDGWLTENCPHLNPSNFYGLTVDKMFTWTPGIPITFPRNRLHVSTPFPRYGIENKLGLSVFISRI
jgi:hypothetical protein